MKQNLKVKKAITPVVATALLLVVVVVAVVGFQTWFNTYSSSLFTKVETQSNQAIENSLSIETVIGNTLYVKNGIANNLTLSAIKISDKDCNISTNLSLGMNQIDISSCMQNLSSNTQRITLITAKKIIDKSVYLKDAQVSSSTFYPLPILSFSSNTTSIAYGDSILLNWTSTYANNCTAFGDWSGNKGINGSISTGNLTQNSTYGLNCSGPGGTVNKTVQVQVAPNIISLVISTNVSDYNLFNALGSPTSPINVKVIVNSGIYVWSDNTAIAAFDTGNLPSGSNVTLINNGYIMGKGGNGGGAYSSSLTYVAATAGGNAINLRNNIKIDNTNGFIGGGGGGSGGGFYSGTAVIGGGGGAGGGAGGGTYNGFTGYFPGGSGGSIGSMGQTPASRSYNGGGGGRIFPSTYTYATSVDTTFLGPNGGSGGGSGFNYGNSPVSNILPISAGGGPGQNGISPTSGTASLTYFGTGGGGGWGASGVTGYSVAGVYTMYPGASGGKAVNKNGYAIIWLSGTSQVYGAIS